MNQILNQVFWDVNMNSFNPMDYPRFTVERILEYGDIEQVRWLEENFEKHKIYEMGKQSRILSLKTKAYLEVRYGD